jgi:RNase H-fold protein (predicted Holliday junction resolvase)
MNKKQFTLKVSDSFERTDEKYDYEISFRRWLVREIEDGKMTPLEAVKQFNFDPESGRKLVSNWREKYAPELVLSLPQMTEKEKQEHQALQKQVKALEKALEDAKMKNIAINMLIDVAEEKLKINIRKKPGAKQ